MGGALGGLFNSTGQGSNFNDSTGKYDPSTAQKLVQGTIKGAGQNLGTAMQRLPMPGGGGGVSAPSATPVDAGYFSPSALPPTGVRPGGPSPFYAQ